ncbi:hypothetical protein FRC17_011298 [Serendipita sp. 399]|nr:hypothetical protein FRC17_011298 [Serendipita sp. 399]
MQLQSIAANLLQRIQAALWLENCPQYSLSLDVQGRPAHPPPTLSTSSTKLVYGLSRLRNDISSTLTSAPTSNDGKRTTQRSRRPLIVIKQDDANPGLLADGHYEIDSRTGFVPCSVPVTSLPAPFGPWESALAIAPTQLALADADDDSQLARAKRLSGQQWRAQFAQMPVLDITDLQQDVGLLRRAHHVLAYLVHFYVHSSPPDPSNPTCILIPKALAVPLVNVSKLLDIAPVLTFADTVLWNHEILPNSEEHDETSGDDEESDRRYTPLTRENIRPLTLFTRGPDEANFYGCCAEIELRGVEALRAIAYFYDSVMTSTKESADGSLTFPSEMDDETLEKAADCLDTVARVIGDLTSILQSVREICDPHAFYFSVRPWFRGSDPSPPLARSGRSHDTSESDDDSGSEAGSIDLASETGNTSAGGIATPTGQRRWIYEGVDEQEILELSGPSAGQSSIIHTLDIFLDVDHSSPHSNGNSSTTTNSNIINKNDLVPSSTTPLPHSSSSSSSSVFSTSTPSHSSPSLVIVDNESKAQLTSTTGPPKPLSMDSLKCADRHQMTTRDEKRSTTPSLLSGHHPSTKLDEPSRFGNRTPSSTFATPDSLSGVSKDDSMRQMVGKCPVMKKKWEQERQACVANQEKASSSSPNGEFMTRMRKYMPGSHQAFLGTLTTITHGESKQDNVSSDATIDEEGTTKEEGGNAISSTSGMSSCPFSRPISIRTLAQAYPDKLLEPYNDAVMALKKFRDAHIRIACLYVVSMSRKGNGLPSSHTSAMSQGAGGEVGGGSGAGSMGMAMCPMMRSKQQSVSSPHQQSSFVDGKGGRRQLQPVRGTGGNELSLLLKSCRDATSRTLLHPTSSTP